MAYLIQTVLLLGRWVTWTAKWLVLIGSTWAPALSSTSQVLVVTQATVLAASGVASCSMHRCMPHVSVICKLAALSPVLVVVAVNHAVHPEVCTRKVPQPANASNPVFESHIRAGQRLTEITHSSTNGRQEQALAGRAILHLHEPGSRQKTQDRQSGNGSCWVSVTTPDIRLSISSLLSGAAFICCVASTFHANGHTATPASLT